MEAVEAITAAASAGKWAVRALSARPVKTGHFHWFAFGNGESCSRPRCNEQGEASDKNVIVAPWQERNPRPAELGFRRNGVTPGFNIRRLWRRSPNCFHQSILPLKLARLMTMSSIRDTRLRVSGTPLTSIENTSCSPAAVVT